MKKLLFSLAFGAMTLPLVAQTPRFEPSSENSLLDGKTIVKTNLFADVFGYYNLKVECFFSGGTYQPIKGYFDYSSGRINDRNTVDPQSFLLTPQVRWYLNGGQGHGFYVMGFYRFQTLSFDGTSDFFTDRNTRSRHIFDYDARLTFHGGGVGIGAQWLFGRNKNVVLDWYILGGGRGTLTPTYKGTYRPAVGDTPAPEDQVRQGLIDMLPGLSSDIRLDIDPATRRVKATGMKFRTEIVELGLSLGFRF